jgi:hypothetical protein
MEIGQSPTGGVPPPAAAPPSRSEIERKLSFKSAARPTAPHNESPKKNKVSWMAPILWNQLISEATHVPIFIPNAGSAKRDIRQRL